MIFFKEPISLVEWDDESTGRFDVTTVDLELITRNPIFLPSGRWQQFPEADIYDVNQSLIDQCPSILSRIKSTITFVLVCCFLGDNVWLLGQNISENASRPSKMVFGQASSFGV